MSVCLLFYTEKNRQASLNFNLCAFSFSLFTKICVKGDLNACPLRNAPINSIKSKAYSQKLFLVTNELTMN